MDDDGSVYMAHAFAKSRCGIKHKIQLSRLDPETLEVVEDGPIVFDGTLSQPTAEGPKMYKRNGWYYIFIPAGGVEYGWQTVLRARNVYGPYEEKIVMHQGTSSINGPHQARGSQRRTAAIGSCISRTGLNWAAWYTCSLCAGTAIGRSSAGTKRRWHRRAGDRVGLPQRRSWSRPANRGQLYKRQARPAMAMAGQPPAEAWLRPVAGDALHLVCGASGSLWRQPMCSVRCCLQRILPQTLPLAWPGAAPELK